MHQTIAVVFDFDDTLGPDSTSAFIESLGDGFTDVPCRSSEEWSPTVFLTC